jgi:hypothetical protein
VLCYNTMSFKITLFLEETPRFTGLPIFEKRREISAPNLNIICLLQFRDMWLHGLPNCGSVLVVGPRLPLNDAVKYMPLADLCQKLVSSKYQG